MRSLLLCLCVVAAAYGAETAATTKAPVTANPADVKATDAAKSKYEDALKKEKDEQKKLTDKLEEANKCQKDLAKAKEDQAAAEKFLAQLTALAAAVKGTEGKKAADAAIVTKQGIPKLAEDSKLATDALEKAGSPPSGKCPTLNTEAEKLKAAVKTAKDATDTAKKEFDEKQKKAAPSAAKPAPGAAPKSQASKDAEAAQEKARKANEKLVKAYEVANTCPAELQKLDPANTPAGQMKKVLEGISAANVKDGDGGKTDKPAIDKEKTAVEADVTKAKEPLEKKKTECDASTEALKKAKEEAKKAQEDADYKQKIANDPSAQTTAATTMATTKASDATTKSTGSTTKGTGSTSSGGTSSATSPAPGGSSKKDEGEDATVNVDGVPLSPDTPCCQKAASGLCMVSILVRNTCNTECGCERKKGTCTGKAPKKCKKSGSSGPGDAPPPPKPACTDKSPNCKGWAAEKSKGYCSAGKAGFFVLQNCASSCNKCSCGGDVDAFHCWAWAFLGECKGSYKGWMEKFCGLSCCDKKAGAGLSLALRRKIVNRIARARTIKRIRAARLSAVAKIKRRRAKAARAALAKKAGSRGFLKAAAARRRRMRIAKARAQRRAQLNN